MDIYAGEYFQFDLPVKDVAGAVVSNLAAATNVQFGVKSLVANDDDYMLYIDSTDEPLQVAIDTPATGTVRITIYSTDTVNLTYEKCYMELQIVYSAKDSRVVRLYEGGVYTKAFTLLRNLIEA